MCFKLKAANYCKLLMQVRYFIVLSLLHGNKTWFVVVLYQRH